MNKVNPTATFAVRAKVRLGLLEKSCFSCALFDREAGQEAIHKLNPAFGAATKHLSPGQMLSAMREDFDDQGQPVEPTAYAKIMKWDQFGLCPRYMTVMHEDYWCGGPNKGKDEKDAWR